MAPDRARPAGGSGSGGGDTGPAGRKGLSALGDLLIGASLIGLTLLASGLAHELPVAPASVLRGGVVTGEGWRSPPRAGVALPEPPPAAGSPGGPAGPAPAAPYRPITRVVIPRLPLTADVVPAGLVQRDAGLTWEVPAFAAGHAERTAGAGGPGNAVLVGHVTSPDAGNVFAALDRVGVGDRVQVSSGPEGFDYRVTDVRVVARSDVSVVGPTERASLSLVTCAGEWLPALGDFAQRLVVRAELVTAETATGAPGAAPPPAFPARLRTVYDERPAPGTGGWPHDPGGTAWGTADGYRLLARTPGEFVALGAPGAGRLAAPLRDVALTGAFRKVGGPPGGGYGLIVRDQGPGPRDGRSQRGRYYVFEAGDRGEVGVWRREDDRWVELLPWTPSGAVRPGGEANELTVQATGSRLTFLANGSVVARVDHPELTEGAVGVFVGGDLNEVVLERLVVQAPG